MSEMCPDCGDIMEDVGYYGDAFRCPGCKAHWVYRTPDELVRND